MKYYLKYICSFFISMQPPIGCLGTASCYCEKWIDSFNNIFQIFWYLFVSIYLSIIHFFRIANIIDIFLKSELNNLYMSQDGSISCRPPGPGKCRLGCYWKSHKYSVVKKRRNISNLINGCFENCSSKIKMISQHQKCFHFIVERGTLFIHQETLTTVRCTTRTQC